jgi:hypothetical protein
MGVSLLRSSAKEPLAFLGLKIDLFLLLLSPSSLFWELLRPAFLYFCSRARLILAA